MSRARQPECHRCRLRGEPVARPRGTALALALAAALALAFATAPPARAEAVRHGGLVLSFDGGIRPSALPRASEVPVRANLSGRIRRPGGGPLPGLERLTIEINRHARIDVRGIPPCPVHRVQSARSSEALRNCSASLVGYGSFGVVLAFPDQGPTPTRGRVLFFHSRHGGSPAVVMHVYAGRPAPVAVAIPLRLRRTRSGPFGYSLVSPRLPRVWGSNVRTTDFDFTLGRRYRHGGRARSYLSASCPAPDGFPGAIFKLARATYDLAGGGRFRQALTRSCRVSR